MLANGWQHGHPVNRWKPFLEHVKCVTWDAYIRDVSQLDLQLRLCRLGLGSHCHGDDLGVNHGVIPAGGKWENVLKFWRFDGLIPDKCIIVQYRLSPAEPEASRASMRLKTLSLYVKRHSGSWGADNISAKSINSDTASDRWGLFVFAGWKRD